LNVPTAAAATLANDALDVDPAGVDANVGGMADYAVVIVAAKRGDVFAGHRAHDFP
jgi:protein-tyrosine-phosphatase